MNTNIFSSAVGTPADQILSAIPDEWDKVFSDGCIYVYRNTAVDAFAIFATDDDNVIRFCDVKKKRENGEYTSIWLYSGIYQNLNTFGDIAFVYDIDKYIERKYNKPLPVCFQLDRKTAQRNVIRKYRNKPVSLSVPLRNNSKQWRSVCDSDGEYRTDFIIIPDIWGELWDTDEEQTIYDEIEDFVFSTVGNYSGYESPTGQRITISWSFKRIPCGVAVVHRSGIDW